MLLFAEGTSISLIPEPISKVFITSVVLPTSPKGLLAAITASSKVFIVAVSTVDGIVLGGKGLINQ